MIVARLWMPPRCSVCRSSDHSDVSKDNYSVIGISIEDAEHDAIEVLSFEHSMEWNYSRESCWLRHVAQPVEMSETAGGILLCFVSTGGGLRTWELEIQVVCLEGFGPVDDIINNQTLEHEVLRCRVVAARWCAKISSLSPPMVVTRDDFVQYSILTFHTCRISPTLSLGIRAKIDHNAVIIWLCWWQSP